MGVGAQKNFFLNGQKSLTGLGRAWYTIGVAQEKLRGVAAKKEGERDEQGPHHHPIARE